MKLLDVPEKLADLIRLGLSATALQVKRPRRARVLIDVMAAARPIQPIPECLDHLAQIGKPDILRVNEQLFIYLSRAHQL